MKRNISIGLLSLAILAGCAGNTGRKAAVAPASQKADRIILGNIITADDMKPFAEAVAVKNGLIQYVGSKDVAMSLRSDETEIIDFGTNSVYPGFLEAHAHGAGGGVRLAGQADLTSGKSVEEYVQTMKEWMESHPNKEIMSGSGWKTYAIAEPDASVLDAICPDKPMALNSVDGHSMWVNSCLMKQFGIDREYAEEMGPSMVHVDTEGNPTGILTEKAATDVIAKASRSTVEEMKEYILSWQEFAFAHGYTAATEAGVELAGGVVKPAYAELEKEGRLKLRTYAYHLVADDSVTPEEDVAQAVKDAEELNGEYFKIIGMKVFIDGVIEAHTGWLKSDYLDTPGYHGLERYNKHDIAVRLVKAASENGFSVHAHTIGNGAIHFMAEAVAEAERETGNFDQRNVFAHLQTVNPEDIRTFADYNIIACTAPLWTPKFPSVFKQEAEYIGEEAAEKAYPIKSFIKAGVVNVSHTDYPVSTAMSIPETFYTGETRADVKDRENTSRGDGSECVTRMDILKSMTVNVAYMWHEEDRLGSLKVGKIANMAVFDTDFIHAPADELPSAKLISTIVDGAVVYEPCD